MIVKADDYADINTFTNPFKDIGSCEAQLVGDEIAARKAAGNWGH